MKRATRWGIGSVSLAVVTVGVLAAIGSVTLETSARDLEPGTITIASLPWAHVMIDGRAVGTTPIVRRPIAAGTHRVVLRAGNGRTHTTTVRIQSGQAAALRVRLDRDPAP